MTWRKGDSSRETEQLRLNVCNECIVVAARQIGATHAAAEQAVAHKCQALAWDIKREPSRCVPWCGQHMNLVIVEHYHIAIVEWRIDEERANFDFKMEKSRLLGQMLCQRGVERRRFNAHAIPVGHKPCRSRVVDMAVSEQQAFHLKLVAVDKRHHLVAFLRAHHARINNYGMMCSVVPQDIDILAKQIHFETGYIHNGRYTTFLVLK